MSERMEIPKRTPENVPPPEPVMIDIEDIDDAREYIQESLAQGIRPIISVPEEYAEELMANGIMFVPKEDLLTGKKFSFVAGTIGLEPFLPEGKERFVMEVNPDGLKIEPRITGKDNHFHGVVGFPNGVPAKSLSLKGKFSKETWDTIAAEDKTKTPPQIN